jgi:hypothetical protein
MRSDGMRRHAARLYARRRQAIEQYVPFWLAAEAAGQDGVSPGQDGFSAKPLKTNDGQDGQDRQDAKNAMARNVERQRETRVPASPQLRSYGHQIHPDHPDHPDPASNGAGLRGQDEQHPASPILTTRPWTDDCAWIADIALAAWRQAKAAVLAEWSLRLEGAWKPILPGCRCSPAGSPPASFAVCCGNCGSRSARPSNNLLVSLPTPLSRTPSPLANT